MLVGKCRLLTVESQLKVWAETRHSNFRGYVEFCHEKGEQILVQEYTPKWVEDEWIGSKRLVKV